MAQSPEAQTDPNSLAGFKLLERFCEVIKPLDQRRTKDPRELDPRRKFDAAGYFSMMLFTLINPVIGTVRGLCEISKSERYQEKTGLPQIGLSTFSHAQEVFSPDVLRGVLRELIATRRSELPADLRKKLGPVSRLSTAPSGLL